MSETRQIVGVTKSKKNIGNLRNICFINIFRVDNCYYVCPSSIYDFWLSHFLRFLHLEL